MNFLSRLISRQPAGIKSLATLSPGEFSTVRSENSPRGRRELLFATGELSLVSTTREFCVQLKVHDLSKDDELSGETPDELVELESEDENTFLVHEELRLGYFLRDGRVVVTWRDLDSENGTMFEFLCSENVSKDALNKFDEVACEAQYGQKYGKTPADPAVACEEFSFDYSQNEGRHTIPQIGDNNAVKSEAGTEAATDNEASAATNTATAAPANDPEDERDSITSAEPSGQPLSEGRIMAQAECNLCVYDSARNCFVSSPAFQQATVVILDQNNYEYFLEVRKAGRAVMGTVVHDELDQYIDLGKRALIFNYSSEEANIVMSYLLQFTDATSLTNVETQLSVAQYEARNRKRFSDVSDSQQDYLTDVLSGMTLNDVEMKDQELTDGSDKHDEDSSASDYSDEEDEAAEEDDYETLQQAETDELGRDKNSALEVGHVNDRTYVLRGNKIGVFKNTERDVKYSTTIDNLGIEDPTRIMLHEQDRTLIIQAAQDPKSLYRMDLETGKIVDEWNVKHELRDFNPVNKFAPTTAETNLLAVADQRMFRIDPRISNGAASRSNQKIYKSNMKFTNIATTANGYIVNANKNGEIRLYDTVSNNAKTLIPGLGDECLGLDVTADGRYVLMTCARYLLLIETGNANSNGFTELWTKSTRPRPRKLQISPENIMFMRQQSGANIKFTPARFNAGLDAKEASIVTSTGPYLVTWSLSKVLRNEKDAYRIKKYTSNVTAENFKFGTDQRVILTLEDDVNMVAKSALKSPEAVLKSRS